MARSGEREPRESYQVAARTATGWSDDASEVVCCLRRLFKAIHQHSKAVHKSTGLSGPQLWALTTLESEPGLSLGEMAGRMFAHASTGREDPARLSP